MWEPAVASVEARWSTPTRLRRINRCSRIHLCVVVIMCIPLPLCIFGGTRLFTRRRKTRCQGWSHRVPCGNRQRRGFSFLFFFRPCAGRRRHRTNRFGRPARRGSPLLTQPPSTVYIDHAFSLTRVCPPISPWGAERQHPLPPSVRAPDAAAAADDDVLRAPSAAATPRVVHQRTQPPVRRWAAANFEAGRCFLHTHIHIITHH